MAHDQSPSLADPGQAEPTEPRPFARQFVQYIAGELVEGEGAPLPVENPYTEQPIALVARSTMADVHRAIAAARQAADDGPWLRLAFPCCSVSSRMAARVARSARGSFFSTTSPTTWSAG